MHIGKSTIIRFSKPQQAFPRKFQTNIKHTVPIGLILNITVFMSEQVEILCHKALGYMRLALPLLGCPMRGPPPSHGQQVPALGDLDVQLTGLLLSVLAPPHQFHCLYVVHEVGSAGKHMLPQVGVSNYITVPNLNFQCFPHIPSVEYNGFIPLWVYCILHSLGSDFLSLTRNNTVWISTRTNVLSLQPLRLQDLDLGHQPHSCSKATTAA